MTLLRGNQDDFPISPIKGLDCFHPVAFLQCSHPPPLFLEDFPREFKEHIVRFSAEGMTELSQRFQKKELKQK